MKLQDILVEAKIDSESFIKKVNAKKIDSVRIIIKNKKGENSLGLDLSGVDIYNVVLHNPPEHGPYRHRTTYMICKNGSKPKAMLALYDFLKPHIDISWNAKVITDDDWCSQVYKLGNKEVDDVGTLFVKNRRATFLITKELVEKTGSEQVKPEQNDPKTGGVFVIGTWGNPYSKDDEHTWTGPYSTKKAASLAIKRILSRGPKNFIDWSGEKTAYFTGLEKFLIGAKKIGLNPKIDEDDLYFKDLD